jgi:hypothetical protein
MSDAAENRSPSTNSRLTPQCSLAVYLTSIGADDEKDKKPWLGMGASFDQNPPKVQFVCSVCGNKSWLPVYVKDKAGNWRATSLSKCMECTAVFTDPQWFTAKRREK